MRFTGKRVFITGAAQGIGAAIAEAFVKEGATVAITDVDGDAAAKLAERLGEPHRAWLLDVTSLAQTQRVFDDAIGAFGGVDIVVANAGVSTMNPVVKLTEEEWDFNMSVNAKGVFFTNQVAVRYFIENKVKGKIVNTASMAGKIGAPYLAHYSASKFAVIGFTQALAREVGAYGINVNAVCPGFVKTGMQDREVEWEAALRGVTAEEVRASYVKEVPLGRLELPEDVANAVLFLASDAADYITGESMNVTGGARMD